MSEQLLLIIIFDMSFTDKEEGMLLFSSVFNVIVLSLHIIRQGERVG